MCRRLQNRTPYTSAATCSTVLMGPLSSAHLVLPDFSDQCVESIIHTHPCFRRRFHKRYTVLFCHLETHIHVLCHMYTWNNHYTIQLPVITHTDTCVLCTSINTNITCTTTYFSSLCHIYSPR